MRKNASLLIVSTILVFLSASVLGYSLRWAIANPIPTRLPSITIGRDGSIDPANVTIDKSGSIYSFTGIITGFTLDVQCDNIAIDGAGLALRAGDKFNADSGITIESNNVTIKNIAIEQFYWGADIRGSNNTITKTSISGESMAYGGVKVTGSHNSLSESNIIGGALGVYLLGDYNNILNNTIDPTLDVESDYNNITHNNLNRGITNFSGNQNLIENNTIAVQFYFTESAKLNKVVGNTLTGTYLSLDKEPNTFYLNNFVNLYGISIKNTNDSAALYSMNVFDNGSVGNYWSNYNGTDANHDGIGDTPYRITAYTMLGYLSDNYPLMTPYDYSTLTTPAPSHSSFPLPTFSPDASAMPSPSPEPSTSPTPSPSIPEFSSWIILPLVFGLVMVAVTLRRKFNLKS